MKTTLLSFKIAIIFIACFVERSNAQTISKPYKPASQELFNEIAHMDSVMFNAFNAHNLEALKTTFSTDLEFYHDKGGLAGYDQTMENFKSLFEKIKTLA